MMFYILLKIFLNFFIVLGEDTLWHLQKFLQYIKKKIILESTSSNILLYLPSSIHGIVSTGFIFAFTYICTQYFHHIHPPIPFPHLLPLPMGTTPPEEDVLYPYLWTFVF
jgi:hypothetical protein